MQPQTASSVSSGMQIQAAPSFSLAVPVPVTLPSLEPIVTVYTQVISVLIAGNELAIQCQHVHRRTKEKEKTVHVTVMWLSLRNASINMPKKNRTRNRLSFVVVFNAISIIHNGNSFDWSLSLLFCRTYCNTIYNCYSLLP